MCRLQETCDRDHSSSPLAQLITLPKGGHHDLGQWLLDFTVPKEEVAASHQCRIPGPTLSIPGICSMNISGDSDAEGMRTPFKATMIQ